jgi:hypothetical protein
MHRFPILYLLISLCGFAVLSSCATQTLKGYNKAETAPGTYTATYFSDPETDYVYKANIAVYGKEFGGIFITKRINDSIHRVAFTTEFGNKLFDFEVSDSSFKVNYILEELDKKIVVNTLKADFMLLLKKQHNFETTFESGDTIAYNSTSGKRHNYLFVNKKDDRLIKLVNATRAKEKVVITYVPAGKTLAKNIIIDHQNIKLKIELNYISN